MECSGRGHVLIGLSTSANFLVTPLIGLVHVGVLEAVISEPAVLPCHSRC